MAITMFDCVKYVIGDKAEYTAEDFRSCYVDMLGDCYNCHVIISAYEAYPSKLGFCWCGDCIGEHGYETVTEFCEQALSEWQCHVCGAYRISETRDGPVCSVTCRECGTVHEQFRTDI